MVTDKIRSTLVVQVQQIYIQSVLVYLEHILTLVIVLWLFDAGIVIL